MRHLTAQWTTAVDALGLRSAACYEREISQAVESARTAASAANDSFRRHPPLEALHVDAVADPSQTEPAPERQPPRAAPSLERSFESVLFPGGLRPRSRPEPDPGVLRDLRLDQVIESVTRNWAEYDLIPFFHARFDDPEVVGHRQEVMRELESGPARRAIDEFARRMRAMRQALPAEKKQLYPRERQRWFLAAAEEYVAGVERLARDLRQAPLTSRGLTAFRDYLESYAGSSDFQRLAQETRAVSEGLARIRYSVALQEGTVTVRTYEDEPDYSIAVEETFRKFRQGVVKEYRATFKPFTGMNHIDAQVVDRVALLHPAIFEHLERFAREQVGFLDPILARFDREVHFYIAYLEHIGRLRQAGLPFCYPGLSARHDELSARESFDLALAAKRVWENAAVVRNDFTLRDPERILVVTGPNQGGKTTFARTFGQLHYLAGLGCPVPGSNAVLFLFDDLFTHFEREEDTTGAHGKLEDELIRVRDILERATSRSIVILNEIFSSTSLEDALFLGRQVLGRLLHLDSIAVCVTFLEELSTLAEGTVSLVAGSDPRDPTVRTFKIERRPADGLAHAVAVAERHRLTYRFLQERLRS